jgi:hypothetical protein
MLIVSTTSTAVLINPRAELGAPHVSGLLDPRGCHCLAIQKYGSLKLSVRALCVLLYGRSGARS